MTNDDLKTRLLNEIKLWTFPTFPEEKLIINELMDYPVISITRISYEQLSAANMKPKMCHDNCLRYVKNVPPNTCSIVHGWLVENGMFTLHSIVKEDGKYFCITPNEQMDDVFYFIPDNKINLIKGPDNVYEFFRDDIHIPSYGLRSNPEKLVSHYNEIKEMLLNGADPEQFLN